MRKEEQNGEPLEYARGFADFLECKIDLSKRPLIPRPETEFWVGEAIKKLKIENCKLKIRCLDMFAGSGCIGVAILRHVKNVKVDFADKYQYFKNPNFIKSDVFSNVPGKYDYIFANPPYIPKKSKNKVQKSVLEFEPHAALFGGGDGLFYIKKFWKQTKEHLSPGGKIFMEFSPEQKREVEAIIKKYKYSSCEFHRDQYNRWRWAEIVF